MIAGGLCCAGGSFLSLLLCCSQEMHTVKFKTIDEITVRRSAHTHSSLWPRSLPQLACLLSGLFCLTPVLLFVRML